jgi:hypothetical protein
MSTQFGARELQPSDFAGQVTLPLLPLPLAVWAVGSQFFALQWFRGQCRCQILPFKRLADKYFFPKEFADSPACWISSKTYPQMETPAMLAGVFVYLFPE